MVSIYVKNLVYSESQNMYRYWTDSDGYNRSHDGVKVCLHFGRNKHSDYFKCKFLLHRTGHTYIPCLSLLHSTSSITQNITLTK